MNRKVMQRLLWKDARTLAPIIITAPIALFGLFAVLWLCAISSEGAFVEQITLAYAIWIVVPNLFAFSAPALLIGSEEESGSLAWLRTLPASWRSIALSKLLLGLSCLGIVWGLSTLCYCLYWEMIPEHVINVARGRAELPEPFYLHVLGQAAFCFTLSLVSFITAYLFRSPITALLCVLPLMIGMTIAYVNFADWMLVNGYGARTEDFTTRQLWIVIGVFSALALTLLCIHHWVAHRRLVAPESNLKHRIEGQLSASDAYRPPFSPPVAPVSWYGATIIRRKPTPRTALLWQHLRQTRWPLICLTAATLIALFLANTVLYNANNFQMMLVSLVITLATISIPCFTFYGDSVRGRSQFFADRGISPTLVWSTRIRVTAAFSLIVAAAFVVVLIFDGQQSDDVLAVVSMLFFGFALCQFISQWSPRPVLAFFAAPAVLGVSAMLLSVLFEHYRSWFGVLFLPGFLLLIATWRMTPKWMARQLGGKNNWRYLGYYFAAIALPFVIVMGARWVTLPEEDTAWRNRMLAVQLRIAETETQILPGATWSRTSRAPHGFRLGPETSPEDLTARMEQELAAEDTAGAFVSFDEVFYYSAFSHVNNSTYLPVGGYRAEPAVNGFGPLGKQNEVTEQDLDEYEARCIERDYTTARVFVKWSRMARREAASGRIGFRTLSLCAEEADAFVTTLLTRHLEEYGLTPEIKELYEAMPDRELIQQSRKMSLINSWQINPSMILGERVDLPTQWWLEVERIRARRLADRAVKMVLQEWEAGTNFASQDKVTQIHQMLHAVGIHREVGRLWVCRRFDQDYAILKKRVENADTPTKSNDE